MRTRTQWVCAAALAASVSVIPTADAVIGSSPGLDCVSDEIVTNQLLQYGGQMAFNTSTTVAIGVWCPVERRAPDNLAITNIRVAVEDGANNVEVRCVAQSCNTLQNAACALSASVGSGTAFVGKTELNLGSVAGFTNGSLAIQCIVPRISNNRASTVLQYRWDD